MITANIKQNAQDTIGPLSFGKANVDPIEGSERYAENMSPEHLLRLLAQEAIVNTLNDRDTYSDEVLIETIEEIKAEELKYFDTQVGSAQYFWDGGQDARLPELGELGNKSDPVKVVSPGEILLKDKIQDELLAVGLKIDMIEGAEEYLTELYSKRASSEVRHLVEQWDRFKGLVDFFGSPDILRNEVSDAGFAYFEEYRDNVTKFGSRPKMNSVQRRLHNITGKSGLTDHEHDDYVETQLDKFRERSPGELLKEYVRAGTMHYARVVFGEVPFGQRQQDTNTSPMEKSRFRDTYQRKMDIEMTEPVDLLDQARDMVSEMSGGVLLDPAGPIYGVYEAKMAEAKQKNKEYQEKYGYSNHHYSSYRPKAKSRKTHESSERDNYRTTRRSTVESQASKEAKMNEEARAVFGQIQNVLGNISNTSLGRQYPRQRSVKFVETILERLKIDPEPRDFRSFFKKAMSDYHPDRENTGDEVLFKEYEFIFAAAKKAGFSFAI